MSLLEKIKNWWRGRYDCPRCGADAVPKCRTCKWWDGDEESEGRRTCYGVLPTPIVQADDRVEHVQPTTMPHQFCEHHQPRETPSR